MRPVILSLLLACSAFGAVAHVGTSGAGSCSASAHSGNVTANCGAVTITFTYTAASTSNGVLFSISCAASSATPTSLTLTATGWTTTQVGSITGSAADGYQAVFRAYPPNTSAATFTSVWSGAGANQCNGFMNDIVDEYSGEDLTNFVDTSASTLGSGTPSVSITPGVNNAMIWAVASDTITAVGNIGGSAATKRGDDAGGDWSEDRLLSGGSGSSISAAFTGSGTFTIFAVSIKQAAGAPTAATRSRGSTF